jgi:hypothetical protein
MNHHLTDDQICRAIAGQSTIDEQRHASTCPDCRVEIERGSRLLAAFRRSAVARADRAAQCITPSLGMRSTATGGWEWAIVATVLVAVCAAVASQVPWRPKAAPASTGGGPVEQAVALGDEFLPLAYSNVPATGGHILRLEVPSSAPVAFGIDPVHLVRPRPDAVLADVVVGEDGLARAVRFVSFSADQRH